MTILSFLALSFIIRISGLASSNLWFDEWVSLQRATMPLAEYFGDKLDFIGVNLWDFILRGFAWGPHWVIRIPALVCGMLSLWLAWRVMGEMNFAVREKTIAALAMACLPGLIWMAQDARYYAPISALYMGSMLAALRGKQVWLGACIVLSFLIHPIGPAYTVPALGIALLYKTLSWRNVLITGALSGAAWIVYLLLTTMDMSAPFWWTGPFTFASFVYSLGQSITVNVLGHPGVYVSFVAAWMIFMAGIYVDFRVWLIWAAPLAILVLVAAVYQNVITYRTLQPAAMGLALASGRVLARWKWTWVPAGILLVGMLVNWDPSTRGGDLQAIADHIRAEWRAGDKIEYSSDAARPLELLLDDLPASTGASTGRTWLIYTDALNGQRSKVEGQSVDMSRNAWQIDPVSVYLYEH